MQLRWIGSVALLLILVAIPLSRDADALHAQTGASNALYLPLVAGPAIAPSEAEQDEVQPGDPLPGEPIPELTPPAPITSTLTPVESAPIVSTVEPDPAITQSPSSEVPTSEVPLLETPTPEAPVPEAPTPEAPMPVDATPVAADGDTQAGESLGEVGANQVIFNGDFETGNLNQWKNGGLISISGAAKANVNSTIVYRGRYAAALTISYANGKTDPAPGVRLAWNAQGRVAPTEPKNLPDEAYYSAHYYFPRQVTTEWWNIMQWKQALIEASGDQTRIPVYFVSVVSQNSKMYLVLRSKVNVQGKYTEPGATVAYWTNPIPIQSWMRLECLYRWSKQADGRIACWQDGTLIWNVNGIITEFDQPYNAYPRQWTVNNYAAKTNPTNPTIYIDDAAIRTQPLGAP